MEYICKNKNFHLEKGKKTEFVLIAIGHLNANADSVIIYEGKSLPSLFYKKASKQG